MSGPEHLPVNKGYTHGLDAGIIQALIEFAETIRTRFKPGGKKAA
jgi:hypothetical protein